MNPTVEVVVTHWRRPENLARILPAFRQQTMPCRLTVVDAGEPDYRLPESARALLDRHYVLNRNFGSFNRYIPLAAYDCDYTYFHDDDMTPGSCVLEFFAAEAERTGAWVVGQIGRRWTAAGYSSESIWENPVDFVVRGYFVRTEHLGHLLHWRRLLGLHGDGHCEDDLLLSLALRLELGGFPHLAVPDHDEAMMNREELPAPFAACDRAGHGDRRTALGKRALALGWVPYGG